MGTALGLAVSPCFNSAPIWWIQGASLHADFANNRMFGTGSLTTAFTLSRASTGYADDTAGNWTSFGNNVQRRTDKGLKIEEARTNLFLNSLTPATQTITVVSGTAYTVALWSSGGTLTLSGAGTGTVNANGSVTFTASTTSLTVTCNSLTGSFQCVNVEAGTFKTSPIATAGASATRAADVVNLASPTTYVSLANASAFIEWEELPGPVSLQRRIFMYRIDGSNYIALEISTDNKVHFFVIAGGVTYANLASTNTVVAGTRYKAAMAWATDRFALRLTSSLGSPANDTSGQTPVGAPVMWIGQAAGFAYMGGNLRQLAFYSSAQSDSVLDALVA